MSDSARQNSSEVLSSWKEIASYLNRGVRTVQRWEVTLGLPVHRPAKKSRSAVLAFRSELDEWLRNDRLAREVNRSAILDDGVTRATISELRRSVQVSKSLRVQIRINLRELKQAVRQYGEAVRTLSIGSPRGKSNVSF